MRYYERRDPKVGQPLGSLNQFGAILEKRESRRERVVYHLLINLGTDIRIEIFSAQRVPSGSETLCKTSPD